MSASDSPDVVDDEAGSRFVLFEDGHQAELAYRQDGDRLVLVHTGVPEELEGRGLGGTLVAAAIVRARRQGSTVVAHCDFARGWLERHPDAAAGVTIAGTAPAG